MPKKATNDTPTVLKYLNNTIARFNPNNNNNSSTNTPPPTQVEANKSQQKKRKATPPPSPQNSPSSTPIPSPLPSSESTAKPQKESAARKKKNECSYRNYRIEKGVEVATIQSKVYVERIRLIEEEFRGDGEEREVVELDSITVQKGVKVRIYNVERDRHVLGLSVPVAGKKYTVYTYNEETEEFEGYPLDDITEFVKTTTSEAEESKVTKLAKMWWKGVKGVEKAKKQKTSKGGAHRRSAAAPARSGEATVLNRLCDEITNLSKKINSLEQQVQQQSIRFDETTRDNFKLLMTNSTELIKAFTHNK